MQKDPPMCIVCSRYRNDGTCLAFPNGIPDAILLEYTDHRRPYVGDGGILFEPNPEVEAFYIQRILENQDAYNQGTPVPRQEAPE